LKEIAKTGKPIVLMINAGRPFVFDWAADNIPAIMYTWWLGTEAEILLQMFFSNSKSGRKTSDDFSENRRTDSCLLQSLQHRKTCKKQYRQKLRFSVYRFG
jgi:hypothetical protein